MPLANINLMISDGGQRSRRAAEENMSTPKKKKKDQVAMELAFDEGWNDPVKMGDNAEPRKSDTLASLSPFTFDHYAAWRQSQMDRAFSQEWDNDDETPGGKSVGYDPFSRKAYIDHLKKNVKSRATQKEDDFKAFNQEQNAFHLSSSSSGHSSKFGNGEQNNNTRLSDMEVGAVLSAAPYDKYKRLTQNADFDELSRYDSAADSTRFDSKLTFYSPYSFDYREPLFDYVNGDKDAGYILFNQKYGGSFDSSSDGVDVGTAWLVDSREEIEQMTDDEVKIFNYLYRTSGKKDAEEYLNHITGELYKRYRTKLEEDATTFAKEAPVAASAVSVSVAPYKALSYIGQGLDYIADGKIDENAPYNRFVYENNAVRETVSNMAEEKYGAVGSTSYNAIMGFADFLTESAITGGSQTAMLVLMGMETAADTVIEAKERGLSDKEAFTLGTLRGTIHAVLNKANADAFLNLDSTGAKYFADNVVQSAKAAGMSDLSELLLDIVLAGDKAHTAQAYRQYVADGMTEEQAFWIVTLEKVREIGLDTVIGGIQGGLRSLPKAIHSSLLDSSGNSGYNDYDSKYYNPETGKYKSSSLADLEHTEIFNDKAIEHIFLGNKGGGYHYEYVDGGLGLVDIDTMTDWNEFGVYRANIEINGKVKKSPNSFFPIDMTPQQIVDAINEAYSNRTYSRKNIYTGNTSSGMEIQMFIDSAGKIISAFPLY